MAGRVRPAQLGISDWSQPVDPQAVAQALVIDAAGQAAIAPAAVTAYLKTRRVAVHLVGADGQWHRMAADDLRDSAVRARNLTAGGQLRAFVSHEILADIRRQAAIAAQAEAALESGPAEVGETVVWSLPGAAAAARSGAPQAARAVPAILSAVPEVAPLIAPALAELAVPLLVGQHLAEAGRVRVAVEDAALGPPPQRETPPLPPLPPSADQVDEQVKRVLPPSVSAPDIQTSTPPFSTGEPLPPPPPLVNPLHEQDPTDYIFLSKQAEILARNMAAAGMGVKPAGYAAHHIVPYNDDRYPGAAESREILNRLGIDINAAVNGVYLPHRFRDDASGMFHPAIHTPGYYRELQRRLEAAVASGVTVEQQRQGVIEALDDIRTELQNGTFPIR